MTKLRTLIARNLPTGFRELMPYGMPGWVVPHTLFPLGDHCNPKPRSF